MFDELSRRWACSSPRWRGSWPATWHFNTLLRARRLRPIDPNALPTPPSEEQRRATQEAAGELKERQS